MISLETAKKLAALQPDKFGTMMGALWFDQFEGLPIERGSPVVQFDKDGNVIPNRYREQTEGAVHWWMLTEMREAHAGHVCSKAPGWDEPKWYEVLYLFDDFVTIADLTPETILSTYIARQEALAEEREAGK